MNDIRLITAPVIEYSAIDAVSEEVKKSLEEVNVGALVATEDNLAFLKKLRAEKNKQFAELEDVRKTIKNLVNDPYTKFETEYASKISTLFKTFDKTLQEKIKAVEDGIKQSKLDELKEYFATLITPEIDFLTFEDVNVKVGLNDSKKSLKAQVETFITKSLDDYNLIMMQENAERILVRYKQTKNASSAITSVMNEIKQEALFSMKMAEPKVVTVESPVEEPTHYGVDYGTKQEKLVTVSFKVTGTIEQLKALKQFIVESGLSYE